MATAHSTSSPFQLTGRAGGLAFSLHHNPHFSLIYGLLPSPSTTTRHLPSTAPPSCTPSIATPHLPSTTPHGLSLQRRLSVTLKHAYGNDAFDLVPLTFSLPAELGGWRQWLDQQRVEGRDPGPWMLKTAQHLGMGLCLLPGEQAYAHSLLPRWGGVGWGGGGLLDV